jgi:hypothetical protein
MKKSGFVNFFLLKSSIFSFHRIFINMRQKIKKENKRVKISITVSPILNKLMEDSSVNKSKLIEKLLIEHYGNKDLH